MDVQQAKIMHKRFIAAMRENGLKERGVSDTDWLIDHLLRKMQDVGISEVNPQTLRSAVLHYWGTDITDRATTKTQATIKTSVSEFWAYCVNGIVVVKRTIYPKGAPSEYKLMFMQFCDFIDTQQIGYTTMQTYKNLMKIFLCFLHDCDIHAGYDIEKKHFHEFVSTYFLPKKEGLKESARIAMIIDWLYAAGYIGFGSHEAFPYGYGRNVGGKKIPSYYTLDELKRLISVVDRSTAIGKRDYLVLCLLAIYGMRIGDVIDLKIDSIDWEAGIISKQQCKTGNPICLPLIDEVKDALLDYLDGGRPESDDPHVLLRHVAPFTGYTTTSSFTRIVTNYMHKACIDPHGRHHGCHALRHSMAGGMIAEGATVEQISDVLGHSTIESTKIYLSFDAKVMKKLGLEVPYVAR